MVAVAAPTRAGGLAVLSFKDGVQIEDVQRHPSGRLLHARLRLGTRVLRVLAVYFPAQSLPRGSFLGTAFKDITDSLPRGEDLVVAGDFNMIGDPILDKSNRQGVTGDNGRMMQMLGDFHAKDVFRELYPDERQFTFYCKSAKVSSRIDRVLVSQSMLHLVMEVKHKKVPVGITDHMFAVRLRLGWRGPRESGPGLWRFPARLLKRPGVAKAIAEVVRKHREEGCGDFDRLTRGLTAKLKKYDKEERKRVKLTRGILEEQVEQLQHKVMADPYDDEVQALLSSREEVKQALKELANDKSPGWDGLPKELFQQHWELLREPMMKMIGEFTATGKLPDAANEAVTILLYKKGAETDIKNYRPITLISGVYKLLAKVVATRMKAVLGQVISKEQHGFLPGRRLTDAVSMVADMIEAGRNENSDWYLLLIDFEKAYDSVRRGFMMDTVAKLGFPPRFVRWIEALHRDVHTRLCVNGWVGEQIEMRKGVRQGCPLVPYLFLCAVEPLSRLAEERKLGIGEGNCDRLSYVGYADDTTLLLEGEQQLKDAGVLL
ncbi:unnamed protein product [Closterium sp. NIES-54]